MSGKTFTIDIDTDGTLEINLKNYEERSPELAGLVEQATGGKVQEKRWAPGNHAHIVNGRKVYHTH
jgi:hypothetical protein